MAISSVLNPQNIIGNRKGTAEQFQNFMTGGNGSLGSSVVNSTSLNKIVPFERGGVRPITPDFNSIVSTISTKTDTALNTNIKNQDNKVQGVVNNIQNVFQTTLQNFTKGYQQKLKSIEDSKPSGILEKFFGLYNNVTGFIQFFGDSKNLNKISTSLKGLRGLFEDSFETAKLIRKTINKIVKQLSSLPVATPSGGGGFNLDIKVPGSPLKSAAGKMLGGGRGKMLALGAGALGAGIAAGGAINALSGSENLQPAVVQQSIPENLADSLSSIVDRFTNAIDSLIKSAGGKPKSAPTTSGGGSSGGGGGNKGDNGDGGGGVTATGSEQQKTEALIAGEEGIRLKAYKDSHGTPTIGYGQTRINGRSVQMGDVMTKDQAVGGLRSNIEEHRKRAIRDIGQDSWNNIKDENSKAVLTSIAYNYGHIPPSVVSAAKSGDPKKISAAVGSLSSNPERRKREADFILTGKSSKLDKDFLAGGKLAAAGVPSAQTQAQVAAAPTQTKAKADAISQPVKSQVKAISMPAEVSSVGGQSQGGGGGGGSAPPPPSGGSPSVPFLPAGNVDNFLVLYSKMVYNIVDG